MIKRPITEKGIDIENPIDSESNIKKKGPKEDDASRKNRTLLWVLITLVFFLLLGRTFYLQIVQGSYYRDVSENNRIREVVIKAPRGIIKDKEGTILAQNIPSFDVVFVPAYLPEEQSEKEKIFDRLEMIVQLEDNKGVKDFFISSRNDNKEAYLLKENIETEQALRIVAKTAELEGIFVSNSAKRQYHDGKVFAHIIGYEGKITEKELANNSDYLMIDSIGKSGIEQFYERFLRGRHGIHRFEVDSNNVIKQDLGVINSVAGDELALYLDASLQKKAYETVKKVLEENPDATGGVLVALDPRNGAVRALVSLPGYDNNLFSGGIINEDYQRLINNEKNPLLNRSIAGEYPPGSTFKPMIAAAALQEKIISEHTSIGCSGNISVGEWNFPDWKAHGATDVKKAIAQSCDVFFYHLGGGHGNINGLGINRINQYAEMFGYGQRTNIDLPGEKSGLIPDNSWKFKALGEKWYIGDSYHAAIGQGYITVTPLQIALMSATIANEGTVYQPQIVNKIISAEDGTEKNLPPVENARVIVDEENLRIVREGMRQTVAGNGGSGRSLGSLEVTSAGKTGTSQFGNEEKLHAWYTSFAPYEDPELAMIVLIEGGGEGHEWAVPVTKEIYQWYFDYKRGTNIPEEDSDKKSDESAGEQ